MGISQSERAPILSLHARSMSMKCIASSLGLTKSTVFYTIKRYRETHLIADPPKFGHRVTATSFKNF
jgi:IS30 family transposase